MTGFLYSFNSQDVSASSIRYIFNLCSLVSNRIYVLRTYILLEIDCQVKNISKQSLAFLSFIMSYKINPKDLFYRTIGKSQEKYTRVAFTITPHCTHRENALSAVPARSP